MIENRLYDLDIESTTDVLKVLDATLSEARFQNEAWTNKRFEKIRQIQIDNRGDVGELFVVRCLILAGKSVEWDRTTDPKNKDWDIVVRDDDTKLEVKTASLDKSKKFQHEALEADRNYDGVVFIDIAPSRVYMTIKTKDEVLASKLHKRRTGKQLKLDWSEKKIKHNSIEKLEDFINTYDKFLARLKGLEDE